MKKYLNVSLKLRQLEKIAKSYIFLFLSYYPILMKFWPCHN